MKWRCVVTLLVLHIDVDSIGGQKNADKNGAADIGGSVQWRVAALGSLVHVDTPLYLCNMMTISTIIVTYIQRRPIVSTLLGDFL